MIGKTISHYKIMEKLGEGGMGVVYKAEDLKLKRTVALKFLPSELTRDQEANQRFIQEAQAASSLDHQNVCTIYEIDETNDGQTFIVMACYDGEVLKDKIQTGPLNIEQAVDIIIQVAEGLKKTHAKGIVHRDIKPANIFITEDGVAKILDFGLAKLAAPAHLTKTGRTLGTVAYMSPEQAKGDKIDHRTDIWSLGVVLYEMLTGQLPFKGEYEHAVIYSILNEEPETIVTGRNDIPPALEQIVYKCLEKQAADRYETAKQLLNDLNKLSDKSIKQKPGPPATKVKVRKRSSQYVIAAFLFMVAIALIVKFGLLREKIKEPKIINVRSITTSASISRWATQISPDGAYVTYASDESGNRDIWVQQILTGQKINLTKDYDGRDVGGRL
jgi:serine/threonine protein kinase